LHRSQLAKQLEEEMREKMALYFEAGAKEVWVCGDFGTMSFFGPRGAVLSKSTLCADFPGGIDLSSSGL
jgi:hypothetical protein